MTPEELVAVVDLICGEKIRFEYSVRTKKGKATSTWKMLRTVKVGYKPTQSPIPTRVVHGPTKAAAWELMEEGALKWADETVRRREKFRKAMNQKVLLP